MKKIFSIVMLLAGWCLASCNEDVQEVVAPQDGDKMSVRAVIGNQPDSRVVLTQKDDGNIKTEWKAGDAFLGVAGANVISFTDANLNGSAADFTPSSKVEDGTVVNALYPLTEDLAKVAASADGFEISLASQDGTLEGLADYTYMTANATAANGALDFTFKHEIVILRLTGMTLPEGVTSVSEVVVSGSGISDVAMANLSGQTPAVAVSATDCSVNVKGRFTVSNKVMEDVYVAFFPTSEISDLAVSVISSANKPYYYSYSGSVQFEAGKVYTLNAKELSGIIRVSQYATYPNESVYYAIDKTDIVALETYATQSNYFENKKIIMLNDIDLGCSSGNNWNPISDFKGVFDGKGGVIKGMYIYTDSEALFGLFKKATNATFMNFTLSGYQYNGALRVNAGGGIVKSATNCSFINCHNACELRARGHIAGIVGSMTGIVIACSNSAKITGFDYYTTQYYDVSNPGSTSGILYGGTSANVVACYNIGELDHNGEKGYSCGIACTASSVYGCYNAGTDNSDNSTINKKGILYSGQVYNSVWLFETIYKSASKCGGGTSSKDNVKCSSVEEVNNNVSVLNEGIKQWNTANPTNTCNYHYVKGTNGKGPQLVYGAPN